MGNFSRMPLFLCMFWFCCWLSWLLHLRSTVQSTLAKICKWPTRGKATFVASRSANFLKKLREFFQDKLNSSSLNFFEKQLWNRTSKAEEQRRRKKQSCYNKIYVQWIFVTRTIWKRDPLNKGWPLNSLKLTFVHTVYVHVCTVVHCKVVK